jgi:hypothetical protein
MDTALREGVAGEACASAGRNRKVELHVQGCTAAVLGNAFSPFPSTMLSEQGHASAVLIGRALVAGLLDLGQDIG